MRRGENTGRATYAQNRYDPTLDRSYDYDHVGRLNEARTASEARGHLIGQGGTQDGPYAHSYRYDQTGNMWHRVGWGGWFNPWLEQWPNFINNRLTANPWTNTMMSYDAAGNLTDDGYQTYTYDATGQQSYASGTGLTQSYDGDGLRGKKVESSVTTYYLRSSVLGGQVVAEITGGVWTRGYVYLGAQLLAVQQGGVSWIHQDPVTKSQRVTNIHGTVTSTVDLDPWGGETSRSSNQAFQPRRYTSYERDANGGDEAMMRRYKGKWHRFAQPDPYDGSYNLTDPQSFNRYAYVQNDPVNFVDPSGLDLTDPPQPTTHIDPADGQPFSVPGINGGTVTIFEDSYSGPIMGNTIVGGDAHSQLLLILLHEQNPFQGTPLSENELNQIRKDVTDLLNDKDCAIFVSSLFDQLSRDTGKRAYSNDPMEIFKLVSFGTRQGPFSAEAGSTVGNKNAFININLPLSTNQFISASNGRVVLHELIHVASSTNLNYSHYEMARAAYEVALAQGYKNLGTKPAGGDPGGIDSRNSDFFSNILFKACRVR